MKIAVTSEGSTLEAAVDPRFGRCKYFIVVDTDTGAFEAVDNVQNLNAAQGAGIQSAETVVNQGAEAVLTGHCGPKAFRTLSTGEVKIYVGVEGTVREAVEAFKAGKLQASENADVEGHW
jgi:predicted Fe-Mo cluster-binding NifX family protein